MAVETGPNDQEFSKYQDPTNQLHKYLKSSLNQFEKVREWADMSTWLQKVNKLLEDFRTPFIKEKIVLAKRLAQC